jgi:hypothetical protein
VRNITIIAVMLWLNFLPGVEKHAIAQAKFYEGKTIRFIVGFTPGGGLRRLHANLKPAHGKTYPRESSARRREYAGRG